MLVDQKSVYRIKFCPKSDDDFTLKREVWIRDSIFVVNKIRMQANKEMNINFIKGLYLEQEFDVKNDLVFLPQRKYALFDLSLLEKRKEVRGYLRLLDEILSKLCI